MHKKCSLEELHSSARICTKSGIASICTKSSWNETLDITEGRQSPRNRRILIGLHIMSKFFKTRTPCTRSSEDGGTASEKGGSSASDMPACQLYILGGLLFFSAPLPRPVLKCCFPPPLYEFAPDDGRIPTQPEPVVGLMASRLQG